MCKFRYFEVLDYLVLRSTLKYMGGSIHRLDRVTIKVVQVEIDTNLVPPVPRVDCQLSLPRISGSCFENLEIHNLIGT